MVVQNYHLVCSNCGTLYWEQKAFPEPQYCGACNRAYRAGVEAGKAEREKLIEALEWIIPMAKGYAVEHDVGRNREIVNHARAVLKDVQTKEGRGE